MKEHKALVVGASGIVGRHAAEHINALPNWSVVGLARRESPIKMPGHFLPVDLTNEAACYTALKGETDITHLFYAGRAPDPDPRIEDQNNSEMLRNILGAAEAFCPNLQHVQLIHGTKWYGSHLGPYKTPAREDDARHEPPNFYFTQQDETAERAKSKKWTWTALRPHMVSGLSVRYPHNIIAVIAVYASICKHLGLPLSFWGKPGCFESLSQLTDARLLAKAMIWAATSPNCRNQAFNIVNGSPFRWSEVWASIADFFDMPVGPIRTRKLSDFMSEKQTVWSEITRKNDLQRLPVQEICDWKYGDFVFEAEWDDVSSMDKARRAGFADQVSTEAMIIDILNAYRDARLIP